MTAWFIIHLIQDKTLFQQVRDAAMTACTIDPTTGEKRLDVKKLGEIPLFQSIYAETLRMHVSINVTREVTEDMKLDGYALKKGYLVQTPSYIAHFDKSIWKDENHPAEEFWAERHIIYTDKIDSEGVPTRVASFSMDGRTGGYFPYGMANLNLSDIQLIYFIGGGISMCPGRHFAKQEMITAAALLIINFDIELLEYVNSDGSKSDRPPKDDPSYCGTAAMPPDRDLKIRWKRL
jgi:cytochrome P450